MKKMILSLSVLMGTSFANATTYICNVNYPNDDYAVEIEITKRNMTVAFFDNDSWENLKFANAEGLECVGCPTNYTYEGNDLLVQFSLTAIDTLPTSGSVTLINGKKSSKYAMTCKKTDKPFSR